MLTKINMHIVNIFKTLFLRLLPIMIEKDIIRNKYKKCRNDEERYVRTKMYSNTIVTLAITWQMKYSTYCFKADILANF